MYSKLFFDKKYPGSKVRGRWKAKRRFRIKQQKNRLLFVDWITASLSRRAPLKIEGSFIRLHPEIDGCAPGFDTCELETPSVIRDVREEPLDLNRVGRVR
ncbi:hypothetical protein TNCV_1844161 [Trichonephila clavipes]|nr:hypothetical protein TNCV_1844161 [Trichonephila clavipes]